MAVQCLNLVLDTIPLSAVALEGANSFFTLLG